jgi:hypothetical protein
MTNPIDLLKERVLNKKGKNKETELTTILDMVREFSCLGEIIGRDFEIKDAKGELLYIIHQKPMAIKQMNTLLEEFATLKKIDNEREAAKWGGKGKIKKRGK